MNSTPAASKSNKTSMDLNDDCLREVFKYLNLDDLSSVADTCNRFKHIAQMHFKTLKVKRIDVGLKNDTDSMARVLKRLSDTLRNFGAFIEAIDVGIFAVKPSVREQNEIIALMTRYCGEKLETLGLIHFDITDATVPKLQPLLQHLRSLTLCHDELTGLTFFKELALRSPSLQKLKLMLLKTSGEHCYFGLFQNFRKLETIAFYGVDVNMLIFYKFLQSNPQLKEIIFYGCVNFDDRIFRVIAECVPQIEKLAITPRRTNNAENFKHLSALTNLRSLFMTDIEMNLGVEICKIDFEKIPLEHLKLFQFEFDTMAGHFVTAISKLSSLKCLDLRFVSGLNASDIINICKQHSELTELFLNQNKKLVLSVDNLLEMLRNAEKLQKLLYIHNDDDDDEEEEEATEVEYMCIGFNTYKKILRIVEQRHHKTSLRICSNLYSEGSDIPDELIESHKNSFAMTIEEFNIDNIDEYDS